MCYGDLPATSMSDPSSFFFPSGVIVNRDISTLHEIDLHDQSQIQEYITHSWYDYDDGKDIGLHPYDGETNLNYTGPTPPYKHVDVEESYSWLKSPRWKDNSMEVGPLARVLVLYAKGHEPTVEFTNFA